MQYEEYDTLWPTIGVACGFVFGLYDIILGVVFIIIRNNKELQYSKYLVSNASVQKLLFDSYFRKARPGPRKLYVFALAILAGGCLWVIASILLIVGIIYKDDFLKIASFIWSSVTFFVCAVELMTSILIISQNIPVDQPAVVPLPTRPETANGGWGPGVVGSLMNSIYPDWTKWLPLGLAEWNKWGPEWVRPKNKRQALLSSGVDMGEYLENQSILISSEERNKRDQRISSDNNSQQFLKNNELFVRSLLNDSVLDLEVVSPLISTNEQQHLENSELLQNKIDKELVSKKVLDDQKSQEIGKSTSLLDSRKLLSGNELDNLETSSTTNLFPDYLDKWDPYSDRWKKRERPTPFLLNIAQPKTQFKTSNKVEEFIIKQLAERNRRQVSPLSDIDPRQLIPSNDYFNMETPLEFSRLSEPLDPPSDPQETKFLDLLNTYVKSSGYVVPEHNVDNKVKWPSYYIRANKILLSTQKPRNIKTNIFEWPTNMLYGILYDVNGIVPEGVREQRSFLRDELPAWQQIPPRPKKLSTSKKIAVIALMVAIITKAYIFWCLAVVVGVFVILNVMPQGAGTSGYVKEKKIKQPKMKVGKQPKVKKGQTTAQQPGQMGYGVQQQPGQPGQMGYGVQQQPGQPGQMGYGVQQQPGQPGKVPYVKEKKRKPKRRPEEYFETEPPPPQGMDMMQLKMLCDHWMARGGYPPADEQPPP